MHGNPIFVAALPSPGGSLPRPCPPQFLTPSDFNYPSPPPSSPPLQGVPEAGDRLVEVSCEEVARAVSQARQQQALEARRQQQMQQVLGQRQEQEQQQGGVGAVSGEGGRGATEGEGEVAENGAVECRASEVLLIVKGDVQGSVEAVRCAVEELSCPEVREGGREGQHM